MAVVLDVLVVGTATAHGPRGKATGRVMGATRVVVTGMAEAGSDRARCNVHG